MTRPTDRQRIVEALGLAEGWKARATIAEQRIVDLEKLRLRLTMQITALREDVTREKELRQRAERKLEAMRDRVRGP